jgi:hypothetical protein
MLPVRNNPKLCSSYGKSSLFHAMVQNANERGGEKNIAKTKTECYRYVTSYFVEFRQADLNELATSFFQTR